MFIQFSYYFQAEYQKRIDEQRQKAIQLKSSRHVVEFLQLMEKSDNKLWFEMQSWRAYRPQFGGTSTDINLGISV